MSLSNVATASIPKYETTLPSDSTVRIEYRPFLVKEEKALLIAAESKSEIDMYRAMREVVTAATYGKLDPETSPLIDIEYLFLQIRARSVGETAKPGFKCPKCSATNSISIDISELKPKRNSNHKKEVKIGENLVVRLRYPIFSDIQKLQDIKSESEKAFRLISICVEKIFTKDQTYNAKDLNDGELLDFIDALLPNQFKMLTEFFETAPTVEHQMDFTCEKCGHQEHIVLRGIQNFFA